MGLGIRIPGIFLLIKRAMEADFNGSTLVSTGTPDFPGLFHESFQDFYLKKRLGLEEFCPGGNFFLHLDELQLNPRGRSRNGAHGGPHKKIRGPPQGASPHIASLLHLFHGLQELHRIQVENRFGLRMIAQRGIITRKSQKVTDAQSSRP